MRDYRHVSRREFLAGATAAADHRDVVQKLARKLIDFRNLQPPNAIAPYQVKVEGFVPPKEWKIEQP